MGTQSTQPQKFVADILRQKSETIDALERQLNRARAESSDAARALQEAREENVACQKDMHELLAQRKGFEERFKAAIAEASVVPFEQSAGVCCTVPPPFQTLRVCNSHWRNMILFRRPGLRSSTSVASRKLKLCAEKRLRSSSTGGSNWSRMKSKETQAPKTQEAANSWSCFAQSSSRSSSSNNNNNNNNKHAGEKGKPALPTKMAKTRLQLKTAALRLCRWPEQKKQTCNSIRCDLSRLNKCKLYRTKPRPVAGRLPPTAAVCCECHSCGSGWQRTAMRFQLGTAACASRKRRLCSSLSTS